MTRINRFLRYWAIFYFYIIVIFTISSIPGQNLRDLFALFTFFFAGYEDTVLFKWDFVSSVGHFVEYFIFGILCIRAINASYSKFNLQALIIPALIFSFLFSLSDEIHHYFVPGRHFAVGDFTIDLLGASFGILCYVARMFQSKY